jgi:uncharacterized protein
MPQKRSSTRKAGKKKQATGTKKSSAGKSATRKNARKSSAKKSPAKKSARRSAPLFKVGRSTIQGRGAFATRDIRRGERIGEYTGERVSWEEADARYDDESQDRHHTFLFEVDDDTVIDAAVGGSPAMYINHSCDPNCEAVIEHGHVFIDALRNIKAGQELFYDYNFILDEPNTPAVKKRYPCWCGAKKCRGTILAKKR